MVYAVIVLAVVLALVLVGSLLLIFELDHSLECLEREVKELRRGKNVK